MSDAVATRPAASAPDGGFTLVELLVAIGVLSVLMAMVSVLMLNGLRAIQAATTANTVQAQQQNALLTMSRLLRYTDNPTTASSPPAAIVQATPSELTFFSLAGAGTVDRLPYKVKLCTTDRGVESFTWAPTLVNGIPVVNNSPNMTVPACTAAGAGGAKRRVLLPSETEHTPSLGFRYWRDRTAADGVGTGDIELIPSGSLTTAQLALLDKVQVVLGDSEVAAPLEQTVVLANER